MNATASLPLSVVAAAAAAATFSRSARASEPELSAPIDVSEFLLLGIPNLPPRGKVEKIDRELHERVLVMNKGFGWSRRALDPEEWTAQELPIVELGAALATTVAALWQRGTFGVIPAAFGGKSLDDWMPGTELYKGAIERARIAQKDGKLVGIFWLQGDTGEDPAKAAEYAKRFSAMITQLRADLGIKYVPVIVGEVKLDASGDALATPLAQVPQEVIPCMFVSSEGLRSGDTPGHLDSAALWEYNDRFSYAWMDLYQP